MRPFRALIGLGALSLMLAVLWLTAPPLPRTGGTRETTTASGATVREVVEGRILAIEALPETAFNAGPGEGLGVGSVSPPVGAPDAGTGAVPPGASANQPALLPRRAASAFTVRLETGSAAGTTVRIVVPPSTVASVADAAQQYKPGDTVLLAYEPGMGSGLGAGSLDPLAPGQSGAGAQAQAGDMGGEDFEIVDHKRWPWLLWGAAFFGAGVIAVTGRQGVRAMVALASAVGVLWWFIIPRLLTGASPVPVALVGCALIAIPSLLLTHGLGRDSFVPLLGAAGSLALVGILSDAFMRVAHLSGLAADEEVALLFALTGGLIDPRGLVMAGMLLGVLGALIDVTVGQAAAVFEFHSLDPTASRSALFMRGMNVGRAHVTAAVHTLALAYAGAGLPLLMLLALNATILDAVWNREFVTAEVLRTAAGSVGLAAAMPLTTWLACLACWPRRPPRRRYASYEEYLAERGETKPASPADRELAEDVKDVKDDLETLTGKR